MKKPLPDEEKKRRAKAHDLISPGRTGWELAPALLLIFVLGPLWWRTSGQGQPVAVASQGPFPQPLWIRFNQVVRLKL